MKPYQTVDRNGTPFKVGDRVRIIGIPDLSGMASDCLDESLQVFQHLVGKYKRVRGFNEYGLAEFSFVMRDSNGVSGWHSVWIEPFLLHVPRCVGKPRRSIGVPS